MAFENKNFSVMAYANGFTLWNYQTADTLDSITGAGYFNEAGSFMRKGDMILTVANNKATIVPSMLCVEDIADGNVSVINMNATA